MAIVEGQKVKVKWNGRNKKHFESKGYTFTNLKDELLVSAIDLTSGSDAKILVECDYCDIQKEILFNQYFKQVIDKNLVTYACKDCASKRTKEKFDSGHEGLKIARECTSRQQINKIYGLNKNKFGELTDVQLLLVNEIVRFCEENKRFPSEKDMTNKKGYVSRTQFYKFFNSSSFNVVYDYVYPLNGMTRREDIILKQKQINKPERFACSKCKNEKIFSSEFFRVNPVNKFGLTTVCKECLNKYANLLNYRKKGIIFNEFEDISPEVWWEHLYKGDIGILPDFCTKEDSIIKIVRHVFLNVLQLNKQQICSYNLHDLKKHKIYHFYTRYYDKFTFLNICFPELEIKQYDLLKSSFNDQIKVEFIQKWIDEGNYSIEDLLNNKYSVSKKMEAMIAKYFQHSVPRMLIWYFNEQNIRNPLTNIAISEFDFKHKPSHFWRDRENRIHAIKEYCINNGISECIKDTEMMKKWVKKYFTQQSVAKIFEYHNYYKTLYDVLVDAFPSLRDDHVLFSWEWHQVNINSRENLIKALRELVL
ncbi:hypothetical protein [Bacillus infantis]|uniref:hypothetical protein n=1 Tax=Bacillus infantis TaxID=324767 RepID=UPI00209E1427|nr:hypothetical protein [Bacillus infantis]MCP1159452.1 hypothetical protein [Bacillus infantis]